MKTKKTLLLILVAILVVGASVTFAVWMTSPKQQLSRAMETMVRSMADAGWSQGGMLQYASPQMQGWLIGNGIEQAPPFIVTLGKVKEFKGEKQYQLTEQNGVKSASVMSLVMFEKAPAVVAVEYSKVEGKWLINTFIVRPLVPEQPATAAPKAEAPAPATAAPAQAPAPAHPPVKKKK